jgi:hypothetical protein
VLGYAEDVVGCKVYFPEEHTAKFVADLRVAEDVVYRDRHELIDDADMESLHFEHVPAADRADDVDVEDTIDDAFTEEPLVSTVTAPAVEPSDFQPRDLEGGEDVSEHGEPSAAEEGSDVAEVSERSAVPEADATVVGSREASQTKVRAVHLDDVDGVTSPVPCEVVPVHALTSASPSQEVLQDDDAVISDQLQDDEVTSCDGNESVTGVCGSVDESEQLEGADESVQLEDDEYDYRARRVCSR